MLTLRPLNNSDEQEFLEIIGEFQLSNPSFEFGSFYSLDIPFDEFVTKTNNRAKGLGLDGGLVPESYLVAIVNDEIVGRVSIRHKLNDFLRTINGHIGYGVRPKFRRQGYAKEILKQSLEICKKLGIESAMLTCDDDNLGSIKTIEINGGTLEETFYLANSNVLKRRYWIDILSIKQ